MWTSTLTRPNLSSAVCTVAKSFENLGMAQSKAAIKILQYVRRTPERGITYGEDGHGRTVVRAFVDSNHATCLDIKRSTSGAALLLGDGTITNRFFFGLALGSRWSARRADSQVSPDIEFSHESMLPHDID